jgi:YD repeat-containing protein
MQNNLPTTFQYDRTGRLLARILPNGPSNKGVTTLWGYNAAGDLQGVTSTRGGDVIDQHSYTPDAVGNISQEVTNGLIWDYTRDGLDRLTQATQGTHTYAWAYNLAGDRLSQTIDGAKTHYGYDGAGRVVSAGGMAAGYDANGNLTTFGSDAYTWDVRNRLVGLSRPGLG